MHGVIQTIHDQIKSSQFDTCENLGLNANTTNVRKFVATIISYLLLIGLRTFWESINLKVLYTFWCLKHAMQARHTTYCACPKFLGY